VVRTGATGGTDVYLVNQSTVEAAMNATRSVRPRASTSMPDRAGTAPGAAVSADGDLWLLVGGTGDGGHRTIRQLQVPAGSSAGAALVRTDHGTVDGPAALGVASTGSTTGTGGDVVAVAGTDRVRVFPATGDPRTARYRAPAGVDAVLPAGNATGRLAFLLHGSTGWSLLSVAIDGSRLRGPTLLRDVPADARLAPPAVSDGSLYTVDRSTGEILRIGLDATTGPVPGAASYPLSTLDRRVVEATDFADAYVVARGSRVVVNSASHANALMIFTDGSHPPVRIAKSAAVTVNAAGSAEALTRSNAPQTTQNPKNGAAKPKAQAAAPINTRIDCQTVTQKPHIPVITSAVPGSRSVALSWSYPVLDPQDCYPSTYVVGVRLVSNGAPQPPASVTVQSQTGVNLTGLFPSTQYDITVTAYIHGQGTESAPVRVTTGPEGPAAPTGLSVSADGTGDWLIGFAGCGDVQHGCVPVQSWTITPSFCDGRGLAGPPPAMTVTADPTSRVQPTVTYPGGPDLLGRGLQFQVQGTGEQGQAGTPSANSGCVYSWAPPDTAALSLHASIAPVAQLGQPTTATVSLDLGADPVTAEGGVGATFSYQLLAGGTVVKTVGPTSQTSVQFGGITAGVAYQAQVTVAPPRHPEAAVTVGPVDAGTAHAPWPTITVSADQPQNQGALQATITVHIGGLSSAAAGGEQFALTGDSGLYCGSTSDTSNWSKSSGLDPQDPLTYTANRTTIFGPSCVIKVQLVQYGSTAVFGDGTSSNSATSNTFAVDPPQLVGVTAADFSAAWDGSANGQSQVAVHYNGGNPLVGLFATGWSLTVTDPDGTTCGNYPAANSLTDVAVDQSCVDKDGASGDNWHVQVSFSYLGTPEGPLDVSPIQGGAAPTYNPPVCDVSAAGLTATWTGSRAAPAVQVNVVAPAQLTGCSGWSAEVVTPSGTRCGTSTDAPPVSIPLTCSGNTSRPGWTVVLGYRDTTGAQQSYTIPSVDGPPPS
jgi:hypothetical protein